MRAERVETVSPVDLSVRTVRRSADSTAWPDVDPEPEDCDSTALLQPPRARAASHVSSAPRPPRRSAVVPRMHYMPDFSVAQFFQRGPPAGPPRREERVEPPPQVALPRVSTLPWPSALPASASQPVAHHSPLLPRYSSNRSSLYPSSSAPALPPGAASGYLLDGLPAPPAAPAAPAPFSAPAPSPRPPPPSVPDVPEGPARIRTKAEMKMQLGDAAAEAVRSWLASSSPLAAESVEPPCAASTSGLGMEPSTSALEDPHVVRRGVLDPVRAPVLDPVQVPAQDAAVAAAPAAGSATPDATRTAVVSSSATLCADEPPFASVAPVFEPLPAGASTAIESDDSQGAWAQSCRDFEMQLGAGKSFTSPKKQLQKNIQKQSTYTCDNNLYNFNKKLARSPPVSPDASENHKVLRQVKNIVSSTESIVKVKNSSTNSSDHSTRRNRRLNKVIKNEPDSDASEGASSVIDEDCASLSSDDQSLRSARTRTSGQRSSRKETLGKRDLSSRSQSKVEIVRSPTRRRKTSSKESSPAKTPLNDQIDLKSGNNAGCSSEPQPSEDENPEKLNAPQTQSVKIRLRTKIVEVERVCLRPKGDGSDFRPGWEEEVFQYKRSLRMPPVLINMSKRFSDVDMDCPKSPLINSGKESAANSSLPSRCSRPNSELDVISTCPDLESEDALSSASQPVSVKNRMGGGRHSIVDKLVEKVSKPASRKKSENLKIYDISGMKAKLQSTLKLKLNEPSTSSKDSNLKKDTNKKKSTSKVSEDFIKSVFGAEKVSPKSDSKALDNKKLKVKSIPNKRKPERLPVRQISLRKRILVIPKTTNGKPSKKLDGTQTDGIVLRPRNVQQGSNTRPVMRSAALVRRSKVVLNSKQQKNTVKTEMISKESACGGDTKKSSIDVENSLSKDCLDSQPPVIRKKVRLRRKFRSGFDYIRKKKRVRKDAKKIEVDVEKEKIVPVVARTPLTEEQIQVTLRNWVINRSHGDTVLHRASRVGYAEVAQYAIEKLNVSPRVADNAGYTPLHEAARRGHVELSKILLENGADVSCSATGGIRPLHEAAESNNVEMLRLLLEYGADPTLATYADETPLSIVEPDSAAHKLLLLHLADVQGLPAPPWKFHGPSTIFDPVTYKGDLALQSAPAVESDSESEIDMFSSEVTPPPLYSFCDEPSSQCWVLIKDLMEVLNIQSEEELMQQLNGNAQDRPTSSQYQNDFVRTREITVEEFLQKTETVTFSAPLVNLPVAECKICLIEFNCRVRELLNEETTSLV
ncbi:uncharacterized protein LOC113211430 isoform X2 [Frankliniella occidentalis]|uniref:Uncharacterized protein LOC113211430 isoform X2 n=1 Tax=Frankliniella occidentalis TaxID=133901 RepID=A0A6J1SWD6_FRAOC|nr:uncharacterized protein LOC113211430 isoform X2 [Frankliniella occidentalis]